MNFLQNELSNVTTEDNVYRAPEKLNGDGDMRVRPGYLETHSYGQGESKLVGKGFKTGLVNGHLFNGMKMELGTMEGNIGKFEKEDDSKGKRVGGELNGKLLGLKGKTKKLKDKIGSTVSVDGETMSGNITGTFNRKEGFNVGMGGNLVQVRGQMGNEKKNFVRVGVSAGEGLGVRGQWGKNDDGDRQIGGGGDIGPVTFDFGLTKTPKWVKQGLKGGKKLLKSGGKKVKKMGDKIINKLDNL